MLRWLLCAWSLITGIVRRTLSFSGLICEGRILRREGPGLKPPLGCGHFRRAEARRLIPKNSAKLFLTGSVSRFDPDVVLQCALTADSFAALRNDKHVGCHGKVRKDRSAVWVQSRGMWLAQGRLAVE